ncbi:hypothetical protein B0H15DRAFT_1022151, partial [Mycena belliarum]
VPRRAWYLRDQQHKFQVRPGGREWTVYGSPQSPNLGARGVRAPLGAGSPPQRAKRRPGGRRSRRGGRRRRADRLRQRRDLPRGPQRTANRRRRPRRRRPARVTLTHSDCN